MSLSVPVRLRIRFILYKHFLYHKNNPLALPLVYRTNTRARRGKRGRSVTRQLEAVLLQYYLFESPLRLPALRRRAVGPSPYAHGAPRELRPACAKKGLNTWSGQSVL